MSTHTLTYESTADMVADAAKRFTPSNSSADTDQDTHGGTFYGSKNLEAAKGLALNGWADKRPLANDLTADLVAKIRDEVVPAVDWIESNRNGHLNVGLYAHGNPRCFTRPIMTEQHARKPVVRLLVSYCCSSAVKNDAIVRRGVAVAALTELLTLAGRSVEIWLEATNENRGGTHRARTIVRAKDGTEQLDMDRYLFLVAHPDMLRRITFAILDGYPKSYNLGRGGSYGYPRNPHPAEVEGFDVHCRIMNSSESWTPAESVKWIRETLTKCGVELSES